MADAKRVAFVYEGSAPGANTNILASNITPTTPSKATAYRITVVLETASVFNVRVTDGTTANTWGLNASAALTASDLYTFTIGVHPTLQYNFQVETDGVIGLLLVEEVDGGAL